MLFGTPRPLCVPQKQDPPFRKLRIHTLAPLLHNDVEVGNWVVHWIAILPYGAEIKEAAMNSAQIVINTRVRSPRDSATVPALSRFPRLLLRILKAEGYRSGGSTNIKYGIPLSRHYVCDGWTR